MLTHYHRNATTGFYISYYRGDVDRRGLEGHTLGCHSGRSPTTVQDNFYQDFCLPKAASGV